MRVAIVTGSTAISPFGKPPMGAFVPEDDRLLADELTRRGARPVRAAWDDEAVDWSQFDLCVIRSAWNYTDCSADFLAWAASLSAVAPLWNPVELLRWNMNKRYLQQLASAGIAVVPSVWLEPGTRPTLAEVAAAQKWETVIIKPEIGISGVGVKRMGQEELAAAKAPDPLRAGTFIVQKYLPSIESTGELSLVFVDGRYGYAVQKFPARGNFSIHSWTMRNRRLAYHVEAAAVTARPSEIDRAKAALKVMNLPSLYLRADFLMDDGQYVLSEIEAISPALYFKQAGMGIRLLADAVMARAA
jgi:glutathione synthase/RimK-type ligase-like ATP-grasp enzyme